MIPETRSEQYLASIVGEDVGELPPPQSRIEHYLNAIAQNSIQPSSAGLIDYNPDATYPDGSIGAAMQEMDGEISENTGDISQLKSQIGDNPATGDELGTWVIGGIKATGANDSTQKRIRLTTYTLSETQGTPVFCDDVIDIYVFEYNSDHTELLAKSADWGKSYTVQNDSILRICVRLASDPQHIFTDEDLALYKTKVYVGTASGLLGRMDTVEERLDEIASQAASYYATEATATIQSAKALMTEPCLVFPLVTDIHYQSTGVVQTFDDCVTNIRNVLTGVKADFLLNLGDISDGDRGDGNTTIARADYVLDKLMALGLPVYQAIGNHDTNYEGSGTLLTAAQTYRAYMSATKDVVINSDTNTDFYKDFDNLGIRLIVVNADYLDDYAFSADTVTWLTGTALDTDKIVIFATHQSSIKTQNYNAQESTNGSDVTDALQAFVTGGGTLIQLQGHNHVDVSFATPWLAIASCCQKFSNPDTSSAGYQAITGYDASGIVSPTRTADTVTADCWDVVIVRPVSRKINFVRFGAGSDREYSF